MREHTERELVLAEWFLLWEDDEEMAGDPAGAMEVERIRSELRRRYLATLAPVAVSRCPFTDEVLTYPMDIVDLDGPFWDVENPVRLPPPETPETFVGLAGALRVSTDEDAGAGPGEVAYFPFLARPGPEVPYVIPEVLSVEGVVAVVSTLSVGPHRGYPIAYFAAPGTDREGVPTVDEWGSDRAWRRDRARGWVWDSSGVDEDDFDYDLGPWVDEGKLRWIEPGDETSTVRSGRQRCPYLDLPGRREVTRIEEHQVWWPSSSPDE